MSTSTKLLIKSWVKVFIASISTALAVLGTNPIDFTTKQLYSILFGAVSATVATIYSYFDKKDPRFGRAISFVAKTAVLASTEAKFSAPVKEDIRTAGNYLESLASENNPSTPPTGA